MDNEKKNKRMNDKVLQQQRRAVKTLGQQLTDDILPYYSERTLYPRCVPVYFDSEKE